MYFRQQVVVKTESLFLSKFLLLKTVITAEQIQLTIKRLAHQVLENHVNLHNTVLIGLQPRGIYLSDRIVKEISAVDKEIKVNYS